MQVSLEQIDRLRERTGISYREAKNILEQVGGDLLEALIYLEEGRGGARNRLSSRGRDISQRLRHFAARLHRTRVRVKMKENTLVELPATYGALGAALFPKLAALGLIGVLFAKGSIEINSGNGSAGEGEPPGDKENLDKKENHGLGLG